VVVSVCSSVDAFLALGFAAQITPGALLAFLVLGPVVDLKLLGLLGVGLMFWPEFGKAAAGVASQAQGAGALGAESSVAAGAAFTVAAVCLSSCGSLAATRNRVRGLPFWPSLGFGMGYGGLATALIAMGMGHSFMPPALLSWWVSLVYLAVLGTVVSFACYLTIQERLGPGPSGSVGVMTPLLALGVSLLFENYRPDAITGVGVLLAVAGNVLMLRRKKAAT